MTAQHTCPNCRNVFQTANDTPGQLVVCPHCRSAVRTRMPTTLVPVGPQDLPVVVVPDMQPFSFEEMVEKQEEREERRELRDDRRVRRYEQREQNYLAITGFILSLTTTLMVLSGLAFSKWVPSYLFLAVFFGFPSSLAGLVVSLFGCFSNRPLKQYAVAGAIMGGVLLLLLLPIGMLRLRWF